MSHPSLKQFRQTPYEAISPSRRELSQAGKTVLVTGGNTGIGFAISRAFVHASAKRVILLGRRPDVVKAAANNLAQEAEQINSPSTVDGMVCDIANLDSVNSLWSQFANEGTVIDVLVLSAAAHGASAPLLNSGLGSVWRDFEANVRSSLDLTERFYKQSGKGVDSRKVGDFHPAQLTTLLQAHTSQFLVNISTNASYMWSVMAPERPSYGLTKNAGTLLMQQIAKDTSVKDMQIVSFHPGGVLTDMARAAGVDENMGIPFDDGTKPLPL
jgi:NAD(P)-dependent dehydrogenase (short-subunit alcohol dehydrogenase family)